MSLQMELNKFFWTSDCLKRYFSLSIFKYAHHSQCYQDIWFTIVKFVILTMGSLDVIMQYFRRFLLHCSFDTKVYECNHWVYDKKIFYFWRPFFYKKARAVHDWPTRPALPINWNISFIFNLLMRLSLRITLDIGKLAP